MKKIDQYRQMLGSLEEWETYLLQESGLPGPRGNIELARAVAEEGDEPLFERLIGFGPHTAPTNSPREFLAFCGVMGLGRLLAEGSSAVLPTIRSLASDPRWRIREAVAMALQRLGARDTAQLVDEMDGWSRGNHYERRAAAAALCEPSLLDDGEQALRVLEMLDRITDDLGRAVDRTSDGFRALRRGLGYCWSVAVASHPELGKPMMERWFDCDDPDVRWVMRENLRKNRLLRADEQWVKRWRQRLGMS